MSSNGLAYATVDKCKFFAKQSSTFYIGIFFGRCEKFLKEKNHCRFSLEALAPKTFFLNIDTQ